uniref:Uncharacterized protein n=1 Tax=Oryza brachyantha TaxID=4533 RepID=J3LCX5_ORYBR
MPMEVTRKMPARVKRIRFTDSQTECEVVLPQSVASGGASSSTARDEATQRKPKRKQRAMLASEGASGDDPPESKGPNLTCCSTVLTSEGWSLREHTPEKSGKFR